MVKPGVETLAGPCWELPNHCKRLEKQEQWQPDTKTELGGEETEDRGGSRDKEQGEEERKEKVRVCVSMCLMFS